MNFTSKYVIIQRPVSFGSITAGRRLFVGRNYSTRVSRFSKFREYNGGHGNYSCWNHLTNFSTSQPRKLHPIIWVLIRPLVKFSAVVAGRSVRKWWQSLPNNKKSLMIDSLKRNRYKWGFGLFVVAITGGVYYRTHVEETPMTGRRRFIAFNPRQIHEMADLQYQLMIGTVSDGETFSTTHAAHKRVESAALRLINSNRDLPQIDEKQWKVTVIAQPIPNAFVFPNGHIFVFKGMLDLFDNDDQLGVVLAHEMAHALLGHGAEVVSYTHLLEMMTVILVAVIWALLPADFLSVVTHWLMHKLVDITLHLPYSRELETEADEIGLQLSAKACFDVREGVTFWKKVHVLETENDEEDTKFIAWLSTHPHPATRATFLQERLPKALLLREYCNCPALPNVNVASKIK